MSEWRVTTFGELVDSKKLQVSDGYRAKNEELGGAGPLFLRAGHVTDSHIDFDGVERFIDCDATRYQTKLSRPRDVIVTTKGNSTGRTAFVTADMPTFVYSPHLSFWRSLDLDSVSPEFLRAWSRGPEFAGQLAGMKTSTDMAPYLSLVDQRRLRISLPPIAVQEAIGWILGALDDKIELNRRMNETLEAMARALFKSWFVDFDPVRAKAEGRRPAGMDAATAALFPSKLTRTSNGDVPDGWPITSVDSLFELDKGLSYKGDGLGSGMPMINLGCFLGGGKFEPAKTKLYAGEYRERHIVEAGEVVMANTDMTQNRVTLGSPGIVSRWRGQSRFLFTHHTFAARRKLGVSIEWTEYLFHLLLQDTARERAEGYATGTTVLALPREAVLGLQFSRPPEQVINAFHSLASSWRRRCAQNDEESVTLTSIRDALLPRLLSGELRIPDAECLAADAV